jgi:hypothetical protein
VNSSGRFHLLFLLGLFRIRLSSLPGRKGISVNIIQCRVIIVGRALTSSSAAQTSIRNNTRFFAASFSPFVLVSTDCFSNRLRE